MPTETINHAAQMAANMGFLAYAIPGLMFLYVAIMVIMAGRKGR